MLKIEDNLSKEMYQELLLVKLRYKAPKSEESQLIEQLVDRDWRPLEQSSDNFRFSAAVTGFSLLLKESLYKGTLSYSQIVQLAESAKGKDAQGYRAKFIELVKKAKVLSMKAAK